MYKRDEIDIERYPGFDFGEISYVLKLLCKMKSNDEVQRAFYAFTTEQKTISGKVIEQVRTEFSDYISRECKFYRKNVDGNPLAHRRCVLDLFQDLIAECREEVKTGQYDALTGAPVVKKDLGNAVRAAKEAVAFVLAWDKFDEEKTKKVNRILPTMTGQGSSTGEPERKDAAEVKQEEDAWEIG